MSELAMKVNDASVCYTVTAEAPDVPAGYKRTEVGVIPEDWEVRPLGQTVDFLDGMRRPVKSSDRAKMAGIFPYYGASGIVDWVNDYLFDENLILLGEDGENILSRNTRLAFRVSGKIWVNNHAHVLRPKEGVDIDYLTEFLESRDYSEYNSGTAQPKLNKQTCSKIPVALPPSAEQHAIAEALSDVDRLLGALESLIAKKRAIKQAAMQQLLTGNTRLPGFSGKWEEKPLGDIVDIIPSGIYGLESGSGQLTPMPVATTAHIDSNDRWNAKAMAMRYFSEQQIDQYTPCEGDLVVVKSSGSAASIQSGKVGFVSKQMAGSFIFSNFLMVLRARSCKPHFIYYQLVSDRMKRMLPNLVEASTYPNLRIKDYLEVRMLLPNGPEQQSITEVLSDMDSEIESLERRRDKTQAIKQAMMQQLLTGKIRLV